MNQKKMVNQNSKGSLRRELGLELASLAGQHLLNIGNAGPDAARKVAVLEPWRDGVLDDDPRQRIGHHALDAITGLDGHLPLLGRHQQQHAVIALGIAQLPMTEQATP